MSNPDDTSAARLDRRAFLATTTLGLAACTAEPKPNSARVVPRKYSPNERLNIAAIGVGDQGDNDVDACSHENIVALCDVDWNYAGEAFQRYPEARKYRDYRKMLNEQRDIDAVIIATPDHGHANAARAAMESGRHVYVQKPMAHTVAETRYLAALADRAGVVTQMGIQGHSNAGSQELSGLIGGGALGEVREVHIWTNRPEWPQGIQAPLPAQPVPPEMDWDLWLGPAAARPYNEGYAPERWRGWWDFGTCALGDMGCHSFDHAFRALKLAERQGYSIEVLEQAKPNAHTGPISCRLRYHFHENRQSPPLDLYWYDGGQRPVWPDDLEGHERLDGEGGLLFIGDAGAAAIGPWGESPQLLGAARGVNVARQDPAPHQSHYRNWTEACKGNGKAVASFEYSAPLTRMVLLGNVALRHGATIAWDESRFHVTNDSAANALLTKTYRSGWELPV